MTAAPSDPVTGASSGSGSAERPDPGDARHAVTDESPPADDVADDSPTADPPAGIRIGGRELPSLTIHLAVLALFVAVAAAIVGINVHRSPGMGVYDETTHADYAYRISHGQIPAKGGIIAPEIRRESACHGASLSIVVLPPCNLKVVPPASAFAVGAQDYNFGHPPVYYAITGGLARLGQSIVGGSGRFITLARLVGIGWLAAAMFVLYFALLRFRIPRSLAIGGGLLLAACPTVTYSSSVITNDAAAALGGAIALYFMGRALVDGKVRPIPLFVWAVLVTGTKVLNALPFLAMAVLFAVIALIGLRAGDRARFKTFAVGAIAIGVGVLLVYKGWSIYQSGRGEAGWVNPIRLISGRPYHGLPFDEWATTLFSGFPPTIGYFLPPVLNGHEMVVWTRILDVIIGAGALGLLAVFKREDYRWKLGAALVGGLIAYPILVEIQVYSDSHVYFPTILPRYGMSLIPWCIAGVVILAAWRPFAKTFLAITVAGLALGLMSYAGVN